MARNVVLHGALPGDGLRTMNATLHYLYDPLCGWCYGAEPLAAAAENVVGLNLKLHAGALWPEPTQLPGEMRHYI